MRKIHFSTTILVLMTLLLSIFSNSIHADSSEKVVVDVRVFSIKGCQATPLTIELVESVAMEKDIKINLTVYVVETPEQAQQQRFIGSPTVQINGLDIDPTARDTELFGVT